MFFGLTLVAAVGRQLIGLIGSPLVAYLLETGLPTSQAAMILASLPIPFRLVTQAAWVVMAGLVVREFPRTRSAWR